MLDQLPPELRFLIYDFIDGNLSNLSLTSKLIASDISVYLELNLASYLRQVSSGEELEPSERDLLLRFHRSHRYDALVLETFGKRFFTLPIEFGLKVPRISKLPPLELGLLRYHFPGREVYNTSNEKEIEPYLDRSFDVGVDSNKVHELNIFTHVDRVNHRLPYRNVVILSGEKIGNDFLANCHSLVSLILPSWVTSIETNFLCECSSLISLTIPDEVTLIGSHFLSGCTSLKILKLPSRLTSIEDCFLWGCRSLTALAIPPGVISIEGHVLWGCRSLTTLILPPGVNSIDCFSFNNCTSLTTLTLHPGLKKIGSCFLSGCHSLTTLILPSGVTSIGCAFLSGCTSLTTINTPDGPIPKEEFIARYR